MQVPRCQKFLDFPGCPSGFFVVFSRFWLRQGKCPSVCALEMNRLERFLHASHTLDRGCRVAPTPSRSHGPPWECRLRRSASKFATQSVRNGIPTQSMGTSDSVYHASWNRSNFCAEAPRKRSRFLLAIASSDHCDKRGVFRVADFFVVEAGFFAVERVGVARRPARDRS